MKTETTMGNVLSTAKGVEPNVERTDISRAQTTWTQEITARIRLNVMSEFMKNKLCLECDFLNLCAMMRRLIICEPART